MVIKKDFIPNNYFGKYMSPFYKMDESIALFSFLCKYFPADLVQSVLQWLDVMATYRFRCDGKFGSLFKFTDYRNPSRVMEVCIDPKTGKILRDGDARAEMTDTLKPNAIYYSVPKGNKVSMTEKQILHNPQHQIIYEPKPCLFGKEQCFSHAGYTRPFAIVKDVVPAIILNICAYKDFNSPVWLATGNSGITGNDLLNPEILKHFQILKEMILCPGAGLYEKAKELEYAIRAQGVNVKTSRFMETVEYEGKQKGDDLSDYVIAEIKRGVPYKEAYEKALDRHNLALSWLTDMVENEDKLK